MGQAVTSGLFLQYRNLLGVLKFGFHDLDRIEEKRLFALLIRYG
jgi:hypothetical protein